MGTPFFRFGRFRLNPQARELFDGRQRVSLPLSTIDCLIHLIQHRDRPVGRDELAAAVWGRVDVSEVSLTHAIMRLRRLLGDTGDEQRVIRTVPRLGYRWVMDVTVEQAEAEQAVARPSPLPADDAATATPESPPQAPPENPRRRVAFAIAALLLVCAALAAVFAVRNYTTRAQPAASAAPPPAMVLPVTLDAPPESAWVRLGLMDLVATELRRGGVATAPSETVVSLVSARSAGAPAIDTAAFPTTLIVRPVASLANGRWTVRLEAHDAQRNLRVDARSDDPVKAGRSAADELLIKLGRTPPADAADNLSVAQETLRQRVNAAVFSGQLDVARNLIATATPALKATPEIALSEAKVEFFAGQYERCRQQIEALLGRLPADASAGLRARALNTLGAAYFRLGRIDEADKVYAEAIRLLENANEPELLAKAYIGSGGVASQRLQLEKAAADYGRARTLLELANDAFGVAAVDLNLGMNAMQRGQPAAALPMLRGASDRFAVLAGEDALAATLVAIVDADLAVLDVKDALATSERFAPLQAHGGNQRQRWELTLARARALAGAGRLNDADALLARIADASDPAQDAIVRAQANGLAADIAIGRSDCARAVDFATSAMTPTLQTAIAPAYAKVWRSRVTGLQCSDQVETAAAEIARLRAWTESVGDDSVRVELALAEAEQAVAERSRDEALSRYGDAMAAVAKRGIPEEMVAVGLPYVRNLIAAGRVDEAVSVNGRIASWADRDARAAAAEALVYKALKKTTAADAAFERARRLAGERVLPDLAGASEHAMGP
jgi:DNA-binding winged helix-turn-helix (wHTH) protein/tetratricopeptide (TPR) repeat protein